MKGGIELTKSDLVAAIAKDADLTKVAAEKVVSSLIENITQTLKKGNKVSLVGFGTFEVSERKARTGVNPQTGEKIKIKATKVAKFRPGKNLKEKIK